MLAADHDQLLQEVIDIAALTEYNRASLIPILRMVKEKYRGIDSEAMQIIADVVGIHPVEVHAVATFYSFLKPQTEGRVVFRLCRTLSCELKGKQAIAEQLQRELGIGSVRPPTTRLSRLSGPTASASATKDPPCW
jgi:NADH:ubiquinone oxidoreductase subunit E